MDTYTILSKSSERICDFTQAKIIAACPVYVLCNVKENAGDPFQKVNITIEHRVIKARSGTCDLSPIHYPEYLNGDIRWLLECLVTHNILRREHIDDVLCALLLSEHDSDPKAVQDALQDLLFQYRQKKRYLNTLMRLIVCSAKRLIELQKDPHKEIEKLLKMFQNRKSKARQNIGNVAMIGRVYVTPTKLYVSTLLTER